MAPSPTASTAPNAPLQPHRVRWVRARLQSASFQIGSHRCAREILRLGKTLPACGIGLPERKPCAPGNRLWPPLTRARCPLGARPSYPLGVASTELSFVVRTRPRRMLAEHMLYSSRLGSCFLARAARARASTAPDRDACGRAVRTSGLDRREVHATNEPPGARPRRAGNHGRGMASRATDRTRFDRPRQLQPGAILLLLTQARQKLTLSRRHSKSLRLLSYSVEYGRMR